VAATIPIARLLTEAGFASPEAQAQARALLEAHGLTNPRKQQIATAKVARARALFAEELSATCGDADCRRLAAARWPERAPVVVSATACAICGGSSQRRAAHVLIAALARAGVSRLLLLGGTPTQHTALRAILAETGVSLRTVDGSGRAHSAAEAARQLAWAQLMVIWASTPLHHKISTPYTSQAPPELTVITVPRRCVESLCRGIAEALEQRARR
jgi:hypothetical protein